MLGLHRTPILAIFALVILTFASALRPHDHPNDLESALVDSQIVPEVLDTVPEYTVEVTYSENYTVSLGNLLIPFEVKEIPTMVTWPADPTKLYTLAMVDPDAPSRVLHFLREIRHWLVVNIPGNNFMNGDTCSGYQGSGPPPASGLHRYVFAVFEQSGHVTVDPAICEADGLNRAQFSLKNFTRNYELGPLVAANFFNSQYVNPSK